MTTSSRIRSVLAAALLLPLAVGCGSGPGGDPGGEAFAQGGQADVPDQEIRPEVGGMNGAVVSGHPLASQAGYEVLRAGGNATDAVVTMAAILAVVRPHMNGVGGDGFGLFYDAESRTVTGINGSGRAPALATPGFYRDQGVERMPGSGPLSITVPGAVSAWEAALERHGTLSLGEALEPAIRIAEEGFMVTTTLADDLENAATRLNEAGQEIYRPGGRALQAGDLLRSERLGATLRRLAEEGAGALYGGSVGATVADFLESEGNPIRLSDLAEHEPTWVDPISTSFRGLRVHTIPPNSQGLTLLLMLGMADRIGLDAVAASTTELLHSLVEIKKIAFADRDRWIADPARVDVPVDRLLESAYLDERATLIGDRAAESYSPGFGDDMTAESAPEGDGDTVYLMAVDESGNAVSWIQSLYGTFGSDLVDPETGIVFQNRGAGFTLEDGDPNLVAPGKRPFHTLMPAMVTREDGGFEMTIGTPGGSGQPQSITQVLIQQTVFGMSPQAAIEAPRFRSQSGLRLAVEDRLPASVLEGLRGRGHEVDPRSGWTATFGNVQVIRRLPSGMLRTGADMRREGASMAY